MVPDDYTSPAVKNRSLAQIHAMTDLNFLGRIDRYLPVDLQVLPACAKEAAPIPAAELRPHAFAKAEFPQNQSPHELEHIPIINKLKGGETALITRHYRFKMFLFIRPTTFFKKAGPGCSSSNAS